MAKKAHARSQIRDTIHPFSSAILRRNAEMFLLSNSYAVTGRMIMGRMRGVSCLKGSSGAVLAFVVFLGTIIFSGEFASAQSVFCPGTVRIPPSLAAGLTVPNITQMSGNCTNPSILGAASGAALASQAIGDLLGSAANEETSVAAKAVEGRREAPPEACPAGEIRVDGICRAQPQPVASIAPALASTLSATPTLPKLSAATAEASASPRQRSPISRFVLARGLKVLAPMIIGREVKALLSTAAPPNP